MSEPLTKEQMRNARLAALGLQNDAAPPSSNVHIPATLQPAHAPNANRTVDDFKDVQRVIYKGGFATEEDMLRWYDQGFQFCSSPCFGLKQGNGGPCGILAAIQAEILKEMLFLTESSSTRTTLPAADEVDIDKLLADAISNILTRAADSDAVVLLQLEETCFNKPMQDWTPGDMEFITYTSADAMRATAGSAAMLAQWRSGVGCVAFLVSLVCSRGVRKIEDDMDDSGGTLIGQYGHCNQELINLLLTGRATSNVIDGEMELGDSGLRLRGVYQRCSIGYLTQLEALRYCEVGSYLKVPQYPIWVVGSSSHFSVLFSLQRQVNEESQAQKLRSTLQRCFKAVDSAECGFIPAQSLKEALLQINLHGDYTGNPALALIDDETALARLRGHLQIDGEIILWSAFWAAISSLMTGKPLDELISIPPEFVPDTGVGGAGAAPEGRMRSDSEIARALQAEIDGESFMPLVPTGPGSTHFPSSGVKASSGSSGGAGGASALDFSALFANANNPGTTSKAVGTNPFDTSAASLSAMESGWGGVQHVPSQSQQPVSAAKAESEGGTRQRSDSEIARELQEQWYAEDGFPAYSDQDFDAGVTRQKHSLSMDVNPGRPEDTLLDDLPDLVPADDAYATPSHKRPYAEEGGFVAKMPATEAAGRVQDFDAALYARASPADEGAVERFEMHHFNGLESSGRSAKLTTFQLLVRSTADAVGVSVAFQSGEHHSAAGFNSPLEEVLRTRWPGCRVDWQGQAPPSID